MAAGTRARAATDDGLVPKQSSSGVGHQHGHGEGCAAVAYWCHATPAPLFPLVGGASVLDDPVDRQTPVRLYRSVSPGLHCFVRMAAPSDVEDVASEVWLAVTAYLCRFREEVEGEAVVFTIVRRRIMTIVAGGPTAAPTSSPMTRSPTAPATPRRTARRCTSRGPAPPSRSSFGGCPEHRWMSSCCASCTGFPSSGWPHALFVANPIGDTTRQAGGQ
jgi:hypothetical protein